MDARTEREKARSVFEELVLLALPTLTEHERVTLLAAGSSWAKWSAAGATAEFIDARKLAKH